jgi:hypothetical protein
MVVVFYEFIEPISKTSRSRSIRFKPLFLAARPPGGMWF